MSFGPLSASRAFELQRAFYAGHTAEAYTEIPHQIVDNPFVSAAYARVVVGFLVSMGELAMELWIGRQEEAITFEEVKRTFDAYLEAFERIVGARLGSLKFLDESTIEFWYG